MKIVIYTDGACPGNGTPRARAGAAAVLIAIDDQDNVVKEQTVQTRVKGAQTNNRAELTAVIIGLKALTKPNVEVEVVTDSEYVEGPMNRGWKKKSNLDLWEELEKVARHHRVTYRWIKGHDNEDRNVARDNKYNDLADTAAVVATTL